MRKQNSEQILTNHRSLSYRPVLNSHGGSDDSEEIESLNSTPQRQRKMEAINPKHESIKYVQSSDEDNRRTENYQMTMQNGQKPKEVVFLQYRDEVKRVQLPSKLDSLGMMKVLFVNAFPSKVSMSHFEDGLKSIYIKDTETGVYYQLEDVSDVFNRAFLKIQELDGLSDTQSEISAYSFRTQTLPHHHGLNNKHESIQDYQLTSMQNGRRNSQDPFLSNNLRDGKPIAVIKDDNDDDPLSNADDDHAIQSTKAKKQQKENNGSFNLYLQKTEEIKVDSAMHDQFDELNELLNTTLYKESQNQDEVVDIQNPGKLNQHLINNLQHQTEINAKKRAIPNYFQPSAFVMAQKESNSRTPGQEYNVTSPTSPKKSSFTITVTSRKTTEKKQPEDPYANHRERADSISDPENPYAVPDKNIAVESFITPPNQLSYRENGNSIPETQIAGRKNLHLPIQAEHFSSNTNISSPVANKNNIRQNAKDTKQNDDSYSVQIADELLSQLLDLEQEVKAQSSSTSSSRSSSFRNRRDSNTSSGSKSSVNSTPNKQVYQQTSTINEETEQRTRGISLPTTQQYQSQNSIKNHSTTIENSPVYATVDKQGNEFRTKSHTITTLGASPSTPIDNVDGKDFVTSQIQTASNDYQKSISIKKEPTREICQKPSITAPDFIELDETARKVKRSIKALRSELSNLQKSHVENTRNFKADLQKKLLEFRKKASRIDDHLQQRLDMSNNFIFANAHPVRERRHRLTADQIEYEKRFADTKERLETLESDMEMLRVDVVNKKKVENPDNLEVAHEDLTSVTKALSELKNRYHGLHDMLNVVITSEVEIIGKEKQFMKEEPQKLEDLIERCKILSSTLFTLQKLASVQNVSQVNSPQLSSQRSIRR